MKISPIVLLLCFFLDLPLLAAAPKALLVSHGEARAIIVAAQNQEDQFAANELERYITSLTGANLKIVAPAEARNQASDMVWLLVGGPRTNPMVQAAERKGLVNFKGLKRGGYILRTMSLDGHRTLVVGGNDGAATAYAVYGLLGHYGVTFLMTGDILPEKTQDLNLGAFNVRSEPAFQRRGLLVSFIYPNRSIMSLADQKKFIDQMMKMKMNYLVIFQFPYEPWLKYSFQGEEKWMGDIATRNTNYQLWARDFGKQLTTGLIGEKEFKAEGVYPRLTAPEFQHVENNEQSFAASHQYLHETIAYAKSKGIDVWLAIDDTSAVPNLARYTTRTLALPFHQIFGTFLCPNNPVSWKLGEVQLQALVESYPEAQGYLLSLPEAYPVCNRNGKDRQFYRSLRHLYPGEAQARIAFTGDIAQDDDTVIDSNAGSLYMLQKIMDLWRQRDPSTKLGILGIGRGYLAPYIYKMFPKNVPFVDMESSAIWTPTGVPMQMYAGADGREVVLMNRIDDDSGMLGMQFNVDLYQRDDVLEGALKYGLEGFASQMNRARGTETNTKYMEEGEWNPQITPAEFYQNYSTEIFGKRAAPMMLRVFQALEKNEKYLGWNQAANFGCCGPPAELNIAYEYYKQPDPFDGPHFRGWRRYIHRAYDDISLFNGSIAMLQDALKDLHSAQPLAAPGSQKYLTYLINKTDAYILHLQTLIAWKQAYIGLDEAFQKKQGPNDPAFVQLLDADLNQFEMAHKKATATAEKWAQVIDGPSDLGTQYRIDTFMVTGTGLAVDLMRNIDNFYHGKDYVKPVDFGKIYVNWPVLSTVPWQASEHDQPQ